MEERTKVKLLDTVWIMRTSKGFYPIRPSEQCKPEDHGKLNPFVVSVEDADGKVLWQRDAEEKKG